MTEAFTIGPDEAEAYRVLRSRIDLSALPPLARAVAEAVLCATADFDYVTDLACDEAALAAGVNAIAAGAPVVVDSAMAAAGITPGVAGRPVICKAAEPLAARLARTAGITVPAAGVRLGFGEAGPGAVWIVGSEPDALTEILRREVDPALVIGLPVGFNGSAAAKEELRESGLPSLSNRSEKGGPAVAAAAFGALYRAATSGT
ncbi:MAG TPA: precorrin-8X methylmutase [Trebonia sp.]|jgi:precorrin-8X/cobalt-precorrin-8 methylmutase|nr:precorrin-8X methylmutase [Trebonia sp.]